MKFVSNRILHQFACLLLAVGLFSCNKEETYLNIPVLGPTQVFYALTNQNVIAVYDAKDVRNIKSNLTITGLAAGENLLSMDFRPATGELYAVSNLSKLYIIDLPSGLARPVASAALNPILAGTTVSIDFNPATDRMRIITSTGQNLRVNPETAIVEASDPTLTNQNITGISHNNSVAGVSTSTLYSLDGAGQKLYKQEPTNSATLVAVGNLEQAIGGNASFEISPSNENALAVGRVGDSTKLYTINLANGKATLAGKFALGTNIRSIAILPKPVAYAVDNNNVLLTFNPSLVKPTFYSKPITGLQNGETIYGMDIRPQNGVLYAIGSTGRLYVINLGTGAATVVGSGPLATALLGNSFGFDVNPQNGIIRLVSNARQNLRIDPITAAVSVDANITLANATLSAAAYSNNFTGASSTVLYVVDHTTDKLYRQEPNTGVLTAIGDLGVDISSANGFDVVYTGTDLGLAVFTVGGVTKLYQINLNTGLADNLSELPTAINAFAVGLKFYID